MPDSDFHDPRLVRMADFLASIGIEMKAAVVTETTQFPGVLIDRGRLVVEESKIRAPGDVLHEAAHIALAPPARRPLDHGVLTGATGGEELTAIAWSWAALLKIGLAPEDIFHAGSYRNGFSSVVLEEGAKGNYIGFPLLLTWGMAYDEKYATLKGVPPFPHMVKWMRGEPPYW